MRGGPVPEEGLSPGAGKPTRSDAGVLRTPQRVRGAWRKAANTAEHSSIRTGVQIGGPLNKGASATAVPRLYPASGRGCVKTRCAACRLAS